MKAPFRSMAPAAALLCATALLAPAALAQAADSERRPWLHVRVTEAAVETVNLNLPLSLLDVALAATKADAHVNAAVAGRDLGVADLRRLWVELKGAPGRELLAARDEDEAVHVLLADEHVRLRVTDVASGESRASAEVPFAVVEALLGGEGDRLDLREAFRRMGRDGGGDLIRASTVGQNTRLRVWID